ncbi:hypothetical protein GIB67_013719 [Kingdonia uniflora]|uniref:Uncharacterized protein n=1 Tax=Kingdonia uniflora TaxID=39325 RepID=A0A7J7NQ44_9MAGN|nr:hypothetical protein GIB67_013719 [Kingdonia uniflora]
MQSTISAGYLFTNNAHLIWESLRKEYSQLENARIFQLSNEIGILNRVLILWGSSAPSENVPIPPTVAEIYAKIVEKTRVFQFLVGLNPDFEYARVHLLNRTHFPTLEEAHAYCLFNQSRRSPMPPISGIPSKTSAMAIRYAYPAPPSVPSQTSHMSSPSLSQLPVASGNSRPSRKKCDYCEDLSSPPSDPLLLSVPCEFVISPLVSPSVSRPLQVYTRRYPERQPPTPDCQASSVAPDLPPAIDSPLSGIEPSPTAFIPVTSNDGSHVSHSDDDRPIAIRKEKYRCLVAAPSYAS